MTLMWGRQVIHFLFFFSQQAALWMNEMYWVNKPSSAKFSLFFFSSLLLPLLTEMIHSSSLSMTEVRRTRWSHSGTERMRRAVSALWLWRLMFLSHATGLSQHSQIHTYPGTHKRERAHMRRALWLDEKEKAWKHEQWKETAVAGWQRRPLQ